MMSDHGAPDIPDDVLMERYAGGNLGAFEELYRRYDRRVYGFCLRYLGDPDAAADAFQEVFVRVIDARERYQGRGLFAAWVFTVASRVCVDLLREHQRTATHAARDGKPTTGASQVGNPEKRLVAMDEVQRVLGALPVEHREVLLLSRYYGFTYGEIADMTGSNESAVKQKAYRALKSLRASKDAGAERTT